jgi:hypothetical protein
MPNYTLKEAVMQDPKKSYATSPKKINITTPRKEPTPKNFS